MSPTLQHTLSRLECNLDDFPLTLTERALRQHEHPFHLEGLESCQAVPATMNLANKSPSPLFNSPNALSTRFLHRAGAIFVRLVFHTSCG